MKHMVPLQDGSVWEPVNGQHIEGQLGSHQNSPRQFNVRGTKLGLTRKPIIYMKSTKYSYMSRNQKFITVYCQKVKVDNNGFTLGVSVLKTWI